MNIEVLNYTVLLLDIKSGLAQFVYVLVIVSIHEFRKTRLGG